MRYTQTSTTNINGGGTVGQVVRSDVIAEGGTWPDFGPGENDTVTITLRIGATGQQIVLDRNNDTITVVGADNE